MNDFSDNANLSNVNRAVGKAIADPVPDIAKLSEAQGIEARGPITRIQDTGVALRQTAAAIAAGRPSLVDVLVAPMHGQETSLGAAGGYGLTYRSCRGAFYPKFDK